MKLLHLILFANSVNCSVFWLFSKARAPETETLLVDAVVVEDEVIIEPEIPVKLEIPVKPVIILKESEDEEKEQFQQELIDQTRHLADQKAMKLSRYLASLPKNKILIQ